MLAKDSIHQSIISTDTNVAVFTHFSMFKNHSLQPIASHKGLPVLTNSPVYYWPSVLLFLVFSLYVLIRVTDNRRIIKIVVSIFNLQVAKQLKREDYKLYKRVSIILSFCFVLVFAFLLFKINNHFELILTDNSSYVKYLFIVSLIIGAYTVKLSVNKLLGFITKTTELEDEYLFNVFLHAQVIGLFLLPFVAFMQFSPLPTEWFMFPSMVICCLFFCLRVFRGFVIGALEQNSGFVYIILYFCALEILPLFVFAKFLINHF